MKKLFSSWLYSKSFSSLLIVILSITAFSCKQKALICEKNCYLLSISGKIVNALTNEPVPNISFTVEWSRNIGWNIGPKKVAELKTKTDGTFSTTVSIDTSRFHKDYVLHLWPEENKKYMILWSESMSDRLAEAAFTNLNFSVYPKVPLTIKLNRVQNDNFISFKIEYYFIDGKTFYPFQISSPEEIKSSEFKVYTCPDLFTRIVVTKIDSNNSFTTTVDSVKCTKNKKNIYTVTF